VTVDDVIFFRPNTRIPSAPRLIENTQPFADSQRSQQEAALSPKSAEKPELIQELEKRAQWSFILGIGSIVFGWTFLMPLFCGAVYIDTCNVASKHNRAIPGKATVGLILAILFGGFQMLAVLKKNNFF